jgi:hypothetical protein
MANCITTDVRDILDTGLDDTALSRLITLADAEMTARGLTDSIWTADLKKHISSLLTASLAAMNDARSSGKGGYEIGEGRTTLSKWYRECAETLITSAERITGKVIGTPYIHIDEDDRYPEGLR